MLKGLFYHILDSICALYFEGSFFSIHSIHQSSACLPPDSRGLGLATHCKPFAWDFVSNDHLPDNESLPHPGCQCTFSDGQSVRTTKEPRIKTRCRLRFDCIWATAQLDRSATFRLLASCVPETYDSSAIGQNNLFTVLMLNGLSHPETRSKFRKPEVRKSSISKQMRDIPRKGSKPVTDCRQKRYRKLVDTESRIALSKHHAVHHVSSVSLNFGSHELCVWRLPVISLTIASPSRKWVHFHV